MCTLVIPACGRAPLPSRREININVWGRIKGVDFGDAGVVEYGIRRGYRWIRKKQVDRDPIAWKMPRCNGMHAHRVAVAERLRRSTRNSCNKDCHRLTSVSCVCSTPAGCSVGLARIEHTTNHTGDEQYQFFCHFLFSCLLLFPWCERKGRVWMDGPFCFSYYMPSWEERGSLLAIYFLLINPAHPFLSVTLAFC